MRFKTAEEDPKEWSGSSLNGGGNDLDDVSLRLLAGTLVEPINNDDPFTNLFSDGGLDKWDDEKVAELVWQ